MFSLLLGMAHAAPATPTVALCGTVLRNQARWSGQSPPTDEEIAGFCGEVGGANVRPEMSLALQCYADEKAYMTAECATAREGDRALLSYPQCVEWARGAVAAQHGPTRSVGLLCNAFAQSPDREQGMLTIHCMGDATFMATDACASVRAETARLRDRAMEMECASNSDMIMTSEFVADASTDHFVPVARAPRATPTPDAVPWVTNEGFTALEWAPDGPVRGVYWVEAAPEPIVHCQLDLDGDGVPQEYVKTMTDSGRRITPDGVR